MIDCILKRNVIFFFLNRFHKNILGEILSGQLPVYIFKLP